MRCIRPLKAGFNARGDVVYSSKKATLELAPFEFECRKCLPCRLKIAREKAIRCYHEAQMHDSNIFLTLTYDDEHLGDNRLNYLDFQLFMKRLRDSVTRTVTDPDVRKTLAISYMVTGEYGTRGKRKHWHAIIFNYHPSQPKHLFTNDRGEKFYEDDGLTKLWGKGTCNFSEVTIESAGYVARYAAKKLVHGKDEEHDFHPIHKTSSRRAIGRSWIEKYYKHVFAMGYVVLPNGCTAGIPRYYSDWLREHHFDEWKYYVTQVRPKIIEKAELTAREEELYFMTAMLDRKENQPRPKTRPSVKLRILESKFKQLQERLKL